MTSPLLLQVGCIAFAGALGAVSRWGLSRGVEVATGGRSHFGTLAVNVLGCLLFGILFEFFSERVPDESHVRTFFLVGFLGAFTTFSTFAFDTHKLMSENALLMSGVNIALNVALGWGAVVLGLLIGRAL